MNKFIAATVVVLMSALMFTSCSPSTASSWDDVIGEDSLEFVVTAYDTTHDIGSQVRSMSEEQQQILLSKLPFDEVESTIEEAVKRTRSSCEWPKTFVCDPDVSIRVATTDDMIRELNKLYDSFSSGTIALIEQCEGYKRDASDRWMKSFWDEQLSEYKLQLEEHQENLSQAIAIAKEAGGRVAVVVKGTASNTYGVPGEIKKGFSLQELNEEL